MGILFVIKPSQLYKKLDCLRDEAIGPTYLGQTKMEGLLVRKS